MIEFVILVAALICMCILTVIIVVSSIIVSSRISRDEEDKFPNEFWINGGGRDDRTE